MIFDNIENWKNYFGTSPHFHEVFEVLATINTEKPNGEYRVNDFCYYKVMMYDTKCNPTIIESHKKEIDIQVILSGKERIKIYSLDEVVITSPYETETDCQFYKSIKEPNLELNLVPGKMAIFFPQDIHGCQYAINNSAETIKKIVIKIDEKLFTH